MSELELNKLSEIQELKSQLSEKVNMIRELLFKNDYRLSQRI